MELILKSQKGKAETQDLLYCHAERARSRSLSGLICLPARSKLLSQATVSLIIALLVCASGNPSMAQETSLNKLEESVEVLDGVEKVEALLEQKQYEKLRILTKRLIRLMQKGSSVDPKDDHGYGIVLYAAVEADLFGRPVDVSAARRHFTVLEKHFQDVPYGDPRKALVLSARAKLAGVSKDQAMTVANGRQWLEHRKAQHGPESIPVALVMKDLAVVMGESSEKSQRDEGRATLGDALALCKKMTGDSSLATLACKVELGIIKAKAEDFDGVKEIVAEIVNASPPFEPSPKTDGASDKYGIDEFKQNTINSFNLDRLNALAILCRDAERFELAMSLFNFVVSKRLERQPKDQPEVLIAQSGLGRAMVLSGDVQAGVEVIKMAYDTGLASQGPKGKIIPSLLLNKAIGLEVAGQHEAAEKAYADAIAGAAEFEADPRVTEQWFAQSFAAALRKSGRTAEADSLMGRAKEIEASIGNSQNHNSAQKPAVPR